MTVQMPFLDGAAPASFKDFTSLDVTCENQWTVSAATDPQDITAVQELATVHQTTFGLGRASIAGYSTHIAPKLTCTAAGPAKVGNIALHYTASEAG